MIYPNPSGFSISGQSASSVYLGENLVWPDVFLFYAPAIGGGTSGDGVTMGTTASFRNMSGGYFENFDTFIKRRLNNNDRISSFSYNPLVDKNLHTYNLTFPAASFDARTPTRAVFAHPASFGTITELRDLDQIGTPSEIITYTTGPVMSGVMSGITGVLSYNSQNYKLYTFANLPTNSTRRYQINKYI